MLTEYNPVHVVMPGERLVLATKEGAEGMHSKVFSHGVFPPPVAVEIRTEGVVRVCCGREPHAVPRSLLLRLGAPPAALAWMTRCIEQEFAGPLVHGVLDPQLGPGLNLIPKDQESTRSVLGPRRPAIPNVWKVPSLWAFWSIHV